MVGGAEWQDGCDFDAELLAACGTDEVVVLPTAAAYEHPDRVVETASRWFEGLGAKVSGLMVLRHAEANDEANAAVVRGARFLYLAGGSPMHLRSVLKDSLVWSALLETWGEGAVIAGSSAGAMVLCDPMVDHRGGAFTLGLGLVEQVAVIPHHDHFSVEKEKRTLDLAPAGLVIAGVDERTALIRDPKGSWRTSGVGEVTVFVGGATSDGLSALP